MNKPLTALIRKHKGRMLKFCQLPKEAKYAMAYYMSIDGEAWEYPEILSKICCKKHRNKRFEKELANNIDFYTKRYGNIKFGFVKIPTKELLSLFINYHGQTFTKKNFLYKKRTQIWPVILEFIKVDEYNPLPIQDGWHRLTDYVTMGLRKIPCLYYIK